MKTGDYVLVGSSAIVALIPLFFYFILPFIKDAHNQNINKKKVCIVVIGPLVRSPRMMFHIKAFLLSGFDVEIISQASDRDLEELNKKYEKVIKDEYLSNSEDDDIENKPTFNFHILESEKYKKQSYVVKAISQTLTLLKMIWSVRSCDYVLMQNPPSIPVLPMLIISKLIFSWKVIIDWHNFGYSIFLLKGESKKIKLLAYLYQKLEFCFGKYADYQIVVTEKMGKDLIQRWELKKDAEKITVVYDYPDEQFQPIKDKVSRRLELIKNIPDIEDIKKDIDITKYVIGVTSTSFTPDEDLQLLLDAIKVLDNRLENINKKFMLIITGKGPMKNEFIQLFNAENFKNIEYRFYYLKLEDYPRLLSLCDFGISLHQSSSSLDLPMKVWDMMGCGLPCIAYSYPTLCEELVAVGETGMVFENKKELVECLEEMIGNESIRLVMTEKTIKRRVEMADAVKDWQLALADCLKLQDCAGTRIHEKLSKA